MYLFVWKMYQRTINRARQQANDRNALYNARQQTLKARKQIVEESLTQRIYKRDVESLERSCQDNDFCSICLNDYMDDDILCASKFSSCGHEFHLNCLQEWLAKHDECPICRQNMIEELHCRKCVTEEVQIRSSVHV